MIRRVQAADRAAVLAVIRAVELLAAEEFVEVEKLLDAYLSGITDSGDRWVTHDVGGRSADSESRSGGVAYYAPERMTDGTWNLYLLAVDPAAHGTGRGTELVHHVEDDLRVAGARTLLIETSGVEDFDRQRRFYRGLGYTEEARIRDFYTAGEDKVIFWKSLTAAPRR